MSEILIETRDLGVTLGGRRVLWDVSLAISRGEIVTIVGPNGSGKSTLLRLLIGALKPDAGTLIRAPGLVFGYVPQRFSVDHTMPMPVSRFLALAGASPSQTASAAARTGINGLAERQMIDLSGGQFQRALLAQAILRNPDVLVLDEAAQGLDQPGVAGFYHLIEDLRAEMDCAVLMVSHDLHVVMAASDRVICLNGHICCEGTPTVVSAAPEYRALFGFGSHGALALYRHDHDHDHHGEPQDESPGAGQ
jgi:zinc transport system ATP-binding protein